MIRRRMPKYCIEDKDRYGKIRIYLRRPGQKKILLTGIPYSEPFMEAYRVGMGGTAIEVAPSLRMAVHGTFRWLTLQYFESAEYKRLDDRVKRVRRQILERIWDEPIATGNPRKVGDCPVPAMTRRAIIVLRDRYADTPEAANSRVKAMRQVFANGMFLEPPACEHNPARDVPYLASNNPDGFHTWTLGEVEQYEATHPIGTKARLAMALLLFVAQRRSDVVLFGKQHAQKGWLIFTQFKNRKKKPIRLAVPIRPELQTIIDASPCGELTYLVTEFGKPFTANGFGNKFREWCDAAGLPQCSAHGLRKAAAARLAELGATEKEIMAITGHTTTKEIVRYTKGAQQRLLATHAMARHGDAEDK